MLIPIVISASLITKCVLPARLVTTWPELAVHSFHLSLMDKDTILGHKELLHVPQPSVQIVVMTTPCVFSVRQECTWT